MPWYVAIGQHIFTIYFLYFNNENLWYFPSVHKISPFYFSCAIFPDSLATCHRQFISALAIEIRCSETKKQQEWMYLLENF